MNLFMKREGKMVITETMLEHTLCLDGRYIEAAIEVLKDKFLYINENFIKIQSCFNIDEHEDFEFTEYACTLEGLMLLISELREIGIKISNKKVIELQVAYINDIQEKGGK